MQIIYTDLKQDVEGLKKDVKGLKYDVWDIRTSVTALQINGLRNRLDDPIQPISAPIEHQDGIRYMVAEDFPKTIRDLWELEHNTAALQRLAKHYSISGWENWKRAASDDSEFTAIDSLDTAVTMYPDKCLRILATQWGLHYSNLQRIITLMRKRKADIDVAEIDQKRLRAEGEVGEFESIITVDKDGNTFLQEREVRLGPRVPVPSEIWRQGLEEHVNPMVRLSSSPRERIIWRARSTPIEEILAGMRRDENSSSVREGENSPK